MLELAFVETNYLKDKLGSIVTRFGEISPLWPKFTSLGQIFDSLFHIWQYAKATLAKL